MSAATHGAIRNITLVAHFILGRRTVLPADLRMSFLNSERDLEDRNNIYTPSILRRTNQNSGHRPGSLVTRTRSTGRPFDYPNRSEYWKG